MTPEQHNHMIGHAAWLAHEACGCNCGMDNPPIAEVERVKAALPYLEEKIRADERERITAWLERESVEYDKLERASGNLRSSSAAGVLSWAANEIKRGNPE